MRRVVAGSSAGAVDVPDGLTLFHGPDRWAMARWCATLGARPHHLGGWSIMRARAGRSFSASLPSCERRGW